jgi:transcriptional regulator GlxA family with amidase domain
MLRIEQAKGLLEQDTLSVEQISWQVGYEDPAFFRRLFRRITHMSPKDYRRKFSMLSVGD